jgi:choline dehydrogenase-like flavoprotein
VQTNALATRVVIEAGQATGVEFLKSGVRQTARARAEVIVSGGVFNSPQLLQLSGLGPGELLRDLGVSVLRDMPAVGTDLQDHFYVRWRFAAPSRSH